MRRIRESGAAERILTNKVSTLSFKQQFPTIPFILVDMQSANGRDTAIQSVRRQRRRCNIQLQTNNNLDNNHNMNEMSRTVTENYVETLNESPEPTDELQLTFSRFDSGSI